MQIGVISDTHGLVRPEVLSNFRDCQLIVHAGDIGSPAVMDSLKELAPVIAVRGNTDKETWAKQYPLVEIIIVKNKCLYILHDLNKLMLIPAASGFHVVISGHSHRPSMKWRGEVLFLNPGSAGPRRFNLPASLSLMEIDKNVINTRIIEL